ncbi:hypothetical protein INN71_15320 [Nocardioides sp. ChNu-153]|uniref:hypothetical protein n=1 Tax=Nocardioides sp. ChNu-153 TaxID=2779364 RepID=UPI0026536E96|nr:hypothetical protein [Nocardioides sp. ChNu-153]MDN7122759.1 hypothetical protein [Nocardioides sp. ChNu-153]
MPDDDTQTTPRLDLDWVKLVAGALAAVSSAFLLSTLGAVGTLLGAALGSVIASVSASLYSASLERSRQKVLAVQVPLRRREPGDATSPLVLHVAAQDVAEGDPPGPPADDTARVQRVGAADGAADPSDPADGTSDGGTTDPSARHSLLVSVPWKRVATWAAGLFLAAMLVLTVIELAVGRSASEITGGSEGGSRTSFSQLTGGGGASVDDDGGPAAPATSGTGTSDPSATGSSEPTGDASQEPSDGATSDDGDAGSDDDEEPTQEPTTANPTRQPSATATPSRPAAGAPATTG